jgi:hypothetical protein
LSIVQQKRKSKSQSVANRVLTFIGILRLPWISIYLTFPCFDFDVADSQELKQFALEGHFAFQDYAIAKWFHHINAFVSSGAQFIQESTNRDHQLEHLSIALDDFMACYCEEDWDQNKVDTCIADCRAFEGFPVHDGLVLLTSYIYIFQQKGFHARHKVSINNLARALERNRKVLEELPSSKDFSEVEFTKYCRFYDHKRLFKCPKITCRYFSEGFKDLKARKKHVNMHERPYACEILDCLGGEGFANQRDLLQQVYLKYYRLIF